MGRHKICRWQPDVLFRFRSPHVIDIKRASVIGDTFDWTIFLSSPSPKVHQALLQPLLRMLILEYLKFLRICFIWAFERRYDNQDNHCVDSTQHILTATMINRRVLGVISRCFDAFSEKIQILSKMSHEKASKLHGGEVVLRSTRAKGPLVNSLYISQ